MGPAMMRSRCVVRGCCYSAVMQEGRVMVVIRLTAGQQPQFGSLPHIAPGTRQGWAWVWQQAWHQVEV